jgi:hypothetical protein
MKALPLAIGLTFGLVGSSFAQAPGNQSNQNQQSISQQAKSSLEQAGFTDIKIIPQSFLIRAKDKNGNPFMMVVDPDSVTAVTELERGNAASSRNSSLQPTTTGVGTSTQAQMLTALPQNATTVANWYKQDVYDPSDNKIGEITDVLVDKDGKIDAFIMSIGGFLGIDTNDVAVPFSAVHATQKNGKWSLTMNATADGLKSAPGYKFDKAKATWIPA